MESSEKDGVVSFVTDHNSFYAVLEKTSGSDADPSKTPSETPTTTPNNTNTANGTGEILLILLRKRRAV